MKKQLTLNFDLIKAFGKEPVLLLKNRTESLNLLNETYEESGVIKIQAVISRVGKQTKFNMRRYYFAEVVEKAAMGLREAGYFGVNKEKADTYLRETFLWEQRYLPEMDKWISDPISIKDIGDREMYEYINKCIIHIETDMNIRVESSEEYKKRYNLQ